MNFFGWFIKATMTYTAFAAAAAVVLWLRHGDWETFASIARSLATWVAVPTLVAMTLLFVVGHRLPELAFRAATVVLLLMSALPAIVGDALVLGVTITVQLAMALALRRPTRHRPVPQNA